MSLVRSETEKTGQVICWLVVLFVALAKKTLLARDSTSPLNNIIGVARPAAERRRWWQPRRFAVEDVEPWPTQTECRGLFDTH